MRRMAPVARQRALTELALRRSSSRMPRAATIARTTPVLSRDQVRRNDADHPPEMQITELADEDALSSYMKTSDD